MYVQAFYKLKILGVITSNMIYELPCRSFEWFFNDVNIKIGE